VRYRSLALAAALLACSPTPGPQPPPAPEACEAACARLAELGCPEAAPTPDGGMCTDVCLNVELSGYATANPRCIAEAESCAAIDLCAGTL